MNCGVGHRHGSDPVLLSLWCRLAATALIQPLAWELPYAEGAAIKKTKRQKKKKKEKKKERTRETIYISPLSKRSRPSELGKFTLAHWSLEFSPKL